MSPKWKWRFGFAWLVLQLVVQLALVTAAVLALLDVYHPPMRYVSSGALLAFALVWGAIEGGTDHS